MEGSQSTETVLESRATEVTMPQTAIEKIVQSHSVGLASGHEVLAGDMVTVRPKHVMTHDNTGAVLPKFLHVDARAQSSPNPSA